MSLWTITSRAEAVDSLLNKAPVLPVLAIEKLEDAVPLARALLEGGLPVLEITLRSDIALDAIAAIKAAVQGIVLGAGTVLSDVQLRAVHEAGAEFAIAPGATAALYQAASGSPIPLIPAIATASELMVGLEEGHRRFKFFPAESAGGIAALQSLAGPFPQARFCPTGGINAERAPLYLALPNVITVGGSWMVPAAAVAARDWARITELAREAVELASH